MTEKVSNRGVKKVIFGTSFIFNVILFLPKTPEGMKFLWFTLLSFFLMNLQAQERILVEGQIKNNDSLLKNVHVRNISSGKYSVSNLEGKFQLNIKAGDTLLLSHVGMEDLISYIKQDDLQKTPVLFSMREISNELKEVVVDENSEINAVSLGIIPKKIERLSVNERRLRQSGDFKPKHLLGIIGGGVSIDAILNAINGRTKKLKRNIEIEEKEKHLAFLEIHHLDYMQKKMKLSEKESRLLINIVIEDDELKRVIDGGNEAEMHFFLLDRWLKFQDELQNKSEQ